MYLKMHLTVYDQSLNHSNTIQLNRLLYSLFYNRALPHRNELLLTNKIYPDIHVHFTYFENP